MKIILSPRAEKYLRKLTKIDQLVVAKKIRSLRNNPRNFDQEKLRGYRDVYRIRVGDYRIVYRRNPKEIHIILIGHRKDIYQILKQLFD